MRENRPYGSEGGECDALPDPYHGVRVAVFPRRDPDVHR
jgi:hypothetical protein